MVEEDKKEDQENRDPSNIDVKPALKDPFRKPLNVIPQVKAAPPPPPTIPPSWAQDNWSLKVSATFSTTASLHLVKSMASRTQNICPSNVFVGGKRYECVDEISEALGHYRFPYPSVSQTQKRRISGLILSSAKQQLRGKGAEAERADLEYFERLLGAWRRAFLSLYEAMRTTRGSYFYYFQQDFGALFRNDAEKGGALEAVLCRCSDGVRAALDREGIQYEATVGDRVRDEDMTALAESNKETSSDEEEAPVVFQESDDEVHSEASDEDEDERNLDSIRAEISARIKRHKLAKIQQRTLNHQGLIRILDVHAFVDYLMNQRNGKSFVILPELISPTPFLYGTYCRAEVVVHGRDVGGVERVKVSGVVLPEGVVRIRKTLENVLGEEGMPVGVALDSDPRTTALNQLPF